MAGRRQRRYASFRERPTHVIFDHHKQLPVIVVSGSRVIVNGVEYAPTDIVVDPVVGPPARAAHVLKAAIESSPCPPSASAVSFAAAVES
jgi:hypothetical protein